MSLSNAASDLPDVPTAPPPPEEPLCNLEDMLDRLSKIEVEPGGSVSLEMMINMVGPRSFGPLLLVCGLVILSPLSGIPGMPTLISIMVILLTTQRLFHRRHFWMPRWILRRSIAQTKFNKAIRFLRPLCRGVDRFLRPRLVFFTRHGAIHVICMVCLALALITPPLELLPFAATATGASLTGFGLALIAHDGLLTLVAMGLTLGTAALITYQLILIT